MEERFEIFVRKYPHKKSVQMLHIIEALIIVLNLCITCKAYNTRKANHSRRNSSNTILSKLGKIKEERILEYLLFIIKENNTSNQSNSGESKIYKILSPTTFELALYFSLCEKHFSRENSLNVPQIISEYTDFNSFNINELRVCKDIIKKQLTSKQVKTSAKNSLNNLISKIDNSLDIKIKEQKNSKNPEIIQDEPNFYGLESYLEESKKRLSIITEYISKIEFSKLSKDKVANIVLKPRFTDVCVVKNSEADNDDADAITNEYFIVDSEEKYSQVFTDYVIKSARKPDPYLIKCEGRSKFKTSRK